MNFHRILNTQFHVTLFVTDCPVNLYFLSWRSVLILESLQTSIPLLSILCGYETFKSLFSFTQTVVVICCKRTWTRNQELAIPPFDCSQQALFGLVYNRILLVTPYNFSFLKDILLYAFVLLSFLKEHWQRMQTWIGIYSVQHVILS